MSSGQEVGEIFRSGSGPSTALLRSPTVLISAIGLWGMNVYFFRLFGLDYIHILNFDLIKEQKEEEASKRRRKKRGHRRKLSREKSSSAAPGSGSVDVDGKSSLNGDANGNMNGDVIGTDKESDIDCEHVDPDEVDMVEIDVKTSSHTPLVSEDVSGGNGANGTASSVFRDSTLATITHRGGGGGVDTTRNGSIPVESNCSNGTSVPNGAGGGGSATTPVGVVASGNIAAVDADNDDMVPLISAPSSSPPSSSDDIPSPSKPSSSTTIGGCEDDMGGVTASKLLTLSISLLILLHLSTYFWIDVFGGTTVGAIFVFYASMVFCFIIPLRSTRWVRVSMAVVVKRALELLNPRCWCVDHRMKRKGPRPIPFVDVFFADAMCSLSKVFFDWGMLWHLASHYPKPVPASAHSIIIPSCCAALPYLIRARQCIIMHTVGKIKNDPKRYLHMLNAIKYSTSLWPICVSAYQKTVSTPEEAHSLEKLLVILLTVNSLYSFAWDVLMDWGMMQNPSAAIYGHTSCISGSLSKTDKMGMENRGCEHACLRPKLRFGALWSFNILVADLILRFFWTMRFYQGIVFPSNDAYILCTEFLEVFRRAIWNLLRVEWENIKQINAKKASKVVVFSKDSEDPKSIQMSVMSHRPRSQ